MSKHSIGKDGSKMPDRTGSQASVAARSVAGSVMPDRTGSQASVAKSMAGSKIPDRTGSQASVAVRSVAGSVMPDRTGSQASVAKSMAGSKVPDRTGSQASVAKSMAGSKMPDRTGSQASVAKSMAGSKMPDRTSSLASVADKSVAGSVMPDRTGSQASVATKSVAGSVLPDRTGSQASIAKSVAGSKMLDRTGSQASMAKSMAGSKMPDRTGSQASVAKSVAGSKMPDRMGSQASVAKSVAGSKMPDRTGSQASMAKSMAGSKMPDRTGSQASVAKSMAGSKMPDRTGSQASVAKSVAGSKMSARTGSQASVAEKSVAGSVMPDRTGSEASVAAKSMAESKGPARASSKASIAAKPAFGGEPKSKSKVSIRSSLKDDEAMQQVSSQESAGRKSTKGDELLARLEGSSKSSIPKKLKSVDSLNAYLSMVDADRISSPELKAVGSDDSGESDHSKGDVSPPQLSGSKSDLTPGENPTSPTEEDLEASPSTDKLPLSEEKTAHVGFSGEAKDTNERAANLKSSIASKSSMASVPDPALDEDMIPVDMDLWRHDHTFEKLREIYIHTIEGLSFSEAQGINMEPVKILFATVWDGLEASHENLKRLTIKDYEMSVDLATKMAQCKTLMKLAEDDQEMSAKLKVKLESTWGLSDEREIEEKAAMAKIAALKDSIFLLNRSIQQAAKAQGQDTIKELNKMKSALENEKAVISTEAGKVQSAYELVRLKRAQNASLRTELKDRTEMLAREETIQKENLARETKRKEGIDASIVENAANVNVKLKDLESMQGKLEEAAARVEEAQRSVLNQRNVNEELQRETEAITSRFDKMKTDYESQEKVCERLTLDLIRRQSDLKEKDDEVLELKVELAHAHRLLNSNQKKVSQYQTEYSRIENERELLRQKLAVMEKELEVIQKKMNQNKKQVEELDRERSLINRNLQRAAAITNEHVGTTKTHELAVQNLQYELTAYEREIAFQKDTVVRLERERDNYSNEATKLAHTVAVRLDEIKLLDMGILEYRRKLSELELQLKKQQQLYDSGIYDKGLLNRSLRDTLTEIHNNNGKIRNLGHKLISLKFQLHEKDVLVQQQAALYEKIEKDTSFFASEATRIKLLAWDISCFVGALEVERLTLGRTVAEAEGEIAKQCYYANAAASRKQVYHRKLMMKEVELRDIWEKWRALHSTVRIGHYHFRNIMAEIRQMRYHIFLLKKEKVVVKNNTLYIRKLKHEVAVLENIVSKEICMCNQLREQLKHPINVHRWRILECTHPEAFEKVQKINLLTKRLVDRNCALVSQSNDLAIKQQIYVQIREVLKRSPGIEYPEDVRYYQHLLYAKNRQYTALKNDMKSSEAQTEYYLEEIKCLEEIWAKLKTSYFQHLRNTMRNYQLKRSNFKQSAKSNNPAPVPMAETENDQEEFEGGNRAE